MAQGPLDQLKRIVSRGHENRWRHKRGTHVLKAYHWVLQLAVLARFSFALTRWAAGVEMVLKE